MVRSAFKSRQLRQQFKTKKPDNFKMQGLMPLRNPVCQTTQYLEQGIVLRDSIKCVTIHYNEKSEGHKAIKQLLDYNFNQIQYKNKDVQMIVIKNVLPNPFMTFFAADGQRFHIDASSKDYFELLHYVQKVAGKPAELIAMENRSVEPNPANFGEGYQRASLCDVDGQLPRSGRFADEFTPEAIKILKGKHQSINRKWKDPEEEGDDY